ncbi:MAG: O-antigen ligase family protein [Thermodesulfobacteriota bacterium]
MFERVLSAERPVVERVALLSMGVYLFALNLPHVVTLREAAFFGAIALAAAAMARRGRIEGPPMKALLALWVGLALVSMAAAADPWHSLSEIKKEIIYPVLAFWLFYVMTRSRDDFALLAYFILAASAIVISLSLYYYFVLGVRFEQVVKAGFLYGKRPYFSFHMLATALVCLALAMRPRTARAPGALLLALVPVVLLGVYFARLRAGYVATLAAGGLFLVYTNVVRRGLKRKLAVLACLLFIALPLPAIMARRNLDLTLDPNMIKVSLDSLKKEERWAIWRNSVERIMERPLLGSGFGNKEIFIPGFRRERIYPHNLLLSYGVATGVAGMALVAVIFGRLYVLLHSRVMSFHGVERSCYGISLAGAMLLVVFVILNMTEDVMTRHSGQFFWALMGMTLGSCRGADPGDGPADT